MRLRKALLDIQTGARRRTRTAGCTRRRLV